MRLKRAISLSFLLVANVIVLAHAIVLHHHHEDTSICFNNSHCQDCKETHDSQTNDRNSYPGKCSIIIDDNYTPASNYLNISCHLHNKCDCTHILYALISTTLYTGDFVADLIIHFRQNPFIPLFYSDFISQSLGLRAPPVC